MSYELKTFGIDGGSTLSEKACENYVCRSCGRKMISVNIVNGICIQVFVSHDPDCRIFIGDVRNRTVDVACDSCLYHSENGCSCSTENGLSSRINEVRTNCADRSAI